MNNIDRVTETIIGWAFAVMFMTLAVMCVAVCVRFLFVMFQ